MIFEEPKHLSCYYFNCKKPLSFDKIWGKYGKFVKSGSSKKIRKTDIFSWKSHKISKSWQKSANTVEKNLLLQFLFQCRLSFTEFHSILLNNHKMLINEKDLIKIYVYKFSIPVIPAQDERSLCLFGYFFFISFISSFQI